MSTNNVRIPISENEKKNITKLLYNGTLPIPPLPILLILLLLVYYTGYIRICILLS